ncbi:MAG TPA: OmpA family protein [Polyangia bacterium]|jgi:outer membrane protein OmpA-like peptidoglycan-associated protein
MRTRHCLFAAAVALLAAGRANAAEKTADRSAVAASPLRMTIDKSKVDLPQHRLEVTLSHQVPKIAIKVTGESGEVLADEEEDVSARPAGAPIIVTWNPARDEPVMRIDLHATDARGSSFDVTLTPYSVLIPHDDVTFRTDSSEIDATEIPKLEAAHKVLSERLAAARGKGLSRDVALYIVGATDTVGSAAHNLKLSQDRARSIALWFRRKGLPIPIAFAGLGKAHVTQDSADQEDQRINRRVDYFLSAGEPMIKAAGIRPMWKRLD